MITWCDFTSFPFQLMQIYITSVSGWLHYTYKTCQIVAGTSMIRQFHEFSRFNFWRVFCNLALLCSMSRPGFVRSVFWKVDLISPWRQHLPRFLSATISLRFTQPFIATSQGHSPSWYFASAQHIQFSHAWCINVFSGKLRVETVTMCLLVHYWLFCSYGPWF